MLSNKPHYIYKIIAIGDTAVGKTSMMSKYSSDTFPLRHDLTIGVDFCAKNVIYNGNNISMHIWDTAGQEAFKSITRTYYRNVACALIVYDVTRRETFTKLKSWIDEVKKSCPLNTIVVLIGNKTDLEAYRMVSTTEGDNLAKQHGYPFIETSAKTGLNIDKIFETVCWEISNKMENTKSMDEISGVTFKTPIKKMNGGGYKCCNIH